MLYGATAAGGTSGLGTLSKLTLATGMESVLHSHGSGQDGAAPPAGAVLGEDGTLHGVTTGGGNDGAIYGADRTAGAEKTPKIRRAALDCFGQAASQ